MRSSWREPKLSVDTATADDTMDMIKRIFDLLIAGAAIVLTLPLILFVSLLIKCESAGPVFDRQERVGLRGHRFVLYNFRCMRYDTEAAGSSVWVKRHPRFTQAGRFIRYTRINELPQMLNVLCGEMSIVGPRPDHPDIVDKLTAAIPFYAERHDVKPGVIGWAQLNTTCATSIEDARASLRYDLYYVRNRSLLFDIRILVRAIFSHT